MLESFLTFINHQKPDVSVKSTLLTVSGGVDSVVLAHLFYRAGFSAAIAHCNFGLRGEESDGDESFVRQLADQYGFPIFVKKFLTKEHADQLGISTQMAARDLRYDWFEKIRNEEKYDFVATAHHANDSLETTLLNLTRGTGIAGLHGIAFQNGNVIRPLLFASKEEIITYATAQNLTYREDSSNASNYYKRNLIRHEVVPVLKQMNPSLETTFQATSRRLKSAETLLDNFLDHWKRDSTEQREQELFISIRHLTETSEPAYRLWFILQDFGFSFIQCEEILSSSGGLSGKSFRSTTHNILKDRDFFIVSKIQKDAGKEELIIVSTDQNFRIGQNEFEISIESKTDKFQFIAGKEIAYFDSAKLTFPLKIRNWAQGDTFFPFGMKGKSKKVSDLLIDLKLNLNQKQQIRILENGNGEILWVVNFRTDERYKVTDLTKEIVIICLTKSSAI